jgi:hypothetical protein
MERTEVLVTGQRTRATAQPGVHVTRPAKPIDPEVAAALAAAEADTIRCAKVLDGLRRTADGWRGVHRTCRAQLF